MNNELPTPPQAANFNHTHKALRENSIIRARVLRKIPIFFKNSYSCTGNDLRAFAAGGLRENSAQTRNLL